MLRYLFAGALCLVSTAHAPPTAHAQPTAPARQDGILPLLPLSLDEFVNAHGGLTRLKFDLKDALPDEIATVLEKQSGVEVVFDDNLQQRADEAETPRYSVAGEGAFWDAISGWNRGDNPIYLVPEADAWRTWRLTRAHEMPTGRAALSGPCRVLAQSISSSVARSRALDPDSKAPARASQGVAMQGRVQLDPKFRPWITLYRVQFTQASDERGRDLLSPFIDFSAPVTPDKDEIANWYLDYPAAGAKTINLLRGVVRLVVVAKSEKWDADLGRNERAQESIKTDDGEVQVNLQRSDENGRFSVQLQMERPVTIQTRRLVSKERDRSWHPGDYDSVSRSARFYDARGEEILAQSVKVERGAEGDKMQSVALSFEFAGEENMGSVKVALEIPLEWREVQAPFEFKDVPLP